jgi:t-SNARE complex subunit (syntaxin)
VAKKKGSSKNRKENYKRYAARNQRDVANQKSVVNHWFSVLSRQIKRLIDTRGEENRELYRMLRVEIKDRLKNNVLTKKQMQSIVSELTA